MLCQKYTSVIQRSPDMIIFDVDKDKLSYDETEILEGIRSIIKKRNLL